jgi:hypothetical protein
MKRNVLLYPKQITLNKALRNTVYNTILSCISHIEGEERRIKIEDIENT